ncbi:MAG: hypothetical protein EOL86_02880 [Deltaproteobacteria bacterium]|nr:hypothetical protein [Deltaproteobacteria bacterium]
MTRLLGLFFLCLALTSACAPKIPLEDRSAATEIWASFHPETPPADQILAQFSLHVAGPRTSGRLLGHIWGYPDSLIRLDLSSSTGGVVAMIRETAYLWAAYLPSENKAYHHDEAKMGLNFFKIPVPFTARQVGSLLSGDLGPLLPAVPAKEQRTPEGRFRFVFRTGDVTSLEATGNGSMLILRGKKGWTLTCETPYENPAFTGRRLFKKFTFESPRDGKAVLRIKTLEQGHGWLAADMDLRPPQDTVWMRLESGAVNN